MMAEQVIFDVATETTKQAGQVSHFEVDIYFVAIVLLMVAMLTAIVVMCFQIQRDSRAYR